MNYRPKYSFDVRLNHPAAKMALHCKILETSGKTPKLNNNA